MHARGSNVTENALRIPLEPVAQNHFGPTNASRAISSMGDMMGPGANRSTTRLGTQALLYVLEIDKIRLNGKKARRQDKTR